MATTVHLIVAPIGIPSADNLHLHGPTTREVYYLLLYLFCLYAALGRTRVLGVVDHDALREGLLYVPVPQAHHCVIEREYFFQEFLEMFDLHFPILVLSFRLCIK